MSEEVEVHIGVARVTDAKVLAHSRYNRIKADNSQGDLSVHFVTDGINAPGPREALLVAIINGINPRWLQISNADEEPGPVDIDFEAVSAIFHGGPFPERANQHDVFHMTEVTHGNMTRLRLSMTNESGSTVHAHTELSKGQVTQMIASLLVLYSRLHED